MTHILPFRPSANHLFYNSKNQTILANNVAALMKAKPLHSVGEV